MTKKTKRNPRGGGRPKKADKLITTSLSIHPKALARLDELAEAKRISRSALIVVSLREHFPSVFADL